MISRPLPGCFGEQVVYAVRAFKKISGHAGMGSESICYHGQTEQTLLVSFLYLFYTTLLDVMNKLKNSAIRTVSNIP